MIVNCVVACMTTEGADFYFCRVNCSQDEYDRGIHYDMAEMAADEDGYDSPMVTFDENDGPDWLFEHFVWESAQVIDSDEADDYVDIEDA